VRLDDEALIRTGKRLQPLQFDLRANNDGVLFGAIVELPKSMDEPHRGLGDAPCFARHAPGGNGNFQRLRPIHRPFY
jgi:hypothetical protein